MNTDNLEARVENLRDSVMRAMEEIEQSIEKGDYEGVKAVAEHVEAELNMRHMELIYEIAEIKHHAIRSMN